MLWNKLSCGCMFYDKGTVIEDIKKVASATTAAGKSCLKALQEPAGAAAWMGHHIACGMKEADKQLNAEIKMSHVDY